MPLAIHSDPVPLRIDEGGDIRVGKSNVLFDFVIEKFKEGATPESLVEGYHTLDLADVYAAIAYYFRHRDEVEAFLTEREKEAERLWQEIQASQPARPSLRDELLARQARMEKENATPAR